MWTKSWRNSIWSQLEQDWDVIIIGGGITGAGVLREAVNAGLNCLLLEARDFSFGTSSRSSKLIHGGFRYLRNKQFDVTYESVREREWMLREARKLVTPLCFLMPNFESYHTSNFMFGFGVVLYDLMGTKWKHRSLKPEKVLEALPTLNTQGLSRIFEYFDAQMDDSRLVLRILQEACALGGTALNYAPVENLLKTADGQVCGVQVRDLTHPDQPTLELKSKVVINCSGPWADQIRGHLNLENKIRKLRGSHLIFPKDKLPIPCGVTIMHPDDNRAMFALPWEGVSMIGTTDLDHDPEYENGEPFAVEEEINYILKALQATFPGLDTGREDMISSFAGLRPIISTGKANPSDESRAHGVLEEKGLYTITGGKITTFRVMAIEVLNRARAHLPGTLQFPTRKRIFKRLPTGLETQELQKQDLAYLLGRYGNLTVEMLSCAQEDEKSRIDYLPNIWAELRWAARSEAVVHLDDLLLRRVRLGLLLPQGGEAHMPQIRQIVQSETGWDDTRWEAELARYQDIWNKFYSPAPTGEN